MRSNTIGLYHEALSGIFSACRWVFKASCRCWIKRSSCFSSQITWGFEHFWLCQTELSLHPLAFAFMSNKVSVMRKQSRLPFLSWSCLVNVYEMNFRGTFWPKHHTPLNSEIRFDTIGRLSLRLFARVCPLGVPEVPTRAGGDALSVNAMRSDCKRVKAGDKGVRRWKWAKVPCVCVLQSISTYWVLAPDISVTGVCVGVCVCVCVCFIHAFPNNQCFPLQSDIPQLTPWKTPSISNPAAATRRKTSIISCLETSSCWAEAHSR